MTHAPSELLFLARVAEDAERYEDMAVFMKEFVLSNDEDLNVEARCLFSTAYKNVLSARRVSWRIADAIFQKERRRIDPGPGFLQTHSDLAAEFVIQMESRVTEVCEEVLELVDGRLLPKAASGESRVFFAKLRADFLRYQAEVASVDVRESLKQRAVEAYEDVTSLGK